MRCVIRRLYAKESDEKRLPAQFPGGLLSNLTQSTDYTAGNMTARMGQPLRVVLQALEILRKMRLVDNVDGSVNSMWEALNPKGSAPPPSKS